MVARMTGPGKVLVFDRVKEVTNVNRFMLRVGIQRNWRNSFTSLHSRRRLKCEHLNIRLGLSFVVRLTGAPHKETVYLKRRHVCEDLVDDFLVCESCVPTVHGPESLRMNG